MARTGAGGFPQSSPWVHVQRERKQGTLAPLKSLLHQLAKSSKQVPSALADVLVIPTPHGRRGAWS